jgi:hypothetical protein
VTQVIKNNYFSFTFHKATTKKKSTNYKKLVDKKTIYIQLIWSLFSVKFNYLVLAINLLALCYFKIYPLLSALLSRHLQKKLQIYFKSSNSRAILSNASFINGLGDGIQILWCCKPSSPNILPSSSRTFALL